MPTGNPFTPGTPAYSYTGTHYGGIYYNFGRAGTYYVPYSGAASANVSLAPFAKGTYTTSGFLMPAQSNAVTRPVALTGAEAAKNIPASLAQPTENINAATNPWSEFYHTVLGGGESQGISNFVPYGENMFGYTYTTPQGQKVQEEIYVPTTTQTPVGSAQAANAALLEAWQQAESGRLSGFSGNNYFVNTPQGSLQEPANMVGSNIVYNSLLGEYSISPNGPSNNANVNSTTVSLPHAGNIPLVYNGSTYSFANPTSLSNPEQYSYNYGGETYTATINPNDTIGVTTAPVAAAIPTTWEEIITGNMPSAVAPYFPGTGASAYAIGGSPAANGYNANAIYDKLGAYANAYGIPYGSALPSMVAPSGTMTILNNPANNNYSYTTVNVTGRPSAEGASNPTYSGEYLTANQQGSAFGSLPTAKAAVGLEPYTFKITTHQNGTTSTSSITEMLYPQQVQGQEWVLSHPNNIIVKSLAWGGGQVATIASPYTSAGQKIGAAATIGGLGLIPLVPEVALAAPEVALFGAGTAVGTGEGASYLTTGKPLSAGQTVLAALEGAGSAGLINAFVPAAETEEFAATGKSFLNAGNPFLQAYNKGMVIYEAGSGIAGGALNVLFPTGSSTTSLSASATTQTQGLQGMETTIGYLTNPSTSLGNKASYIYSELPSAIYNFAQGAEAGTVTGAAFGSRYGGLYEGAFRALGYVPGLNAAGKIASPRLTMAISNVAMTGTQNFLAGKPISYVLASAGISGGVGYGLAGYFEPPEIGQSTNKLSSVSYIQESNLPIAERTTSTYAIQKPFEPHDALTYLAGSFKVTRENPSPIYYAEGAKSPAFSVTIKGNEIGYSFNPYLPTDYAGLSKAISTQLWGEPVNFAAGLSGEETLFTGEQKIGIRNVHNIRTQTTETFTKSGWFFPTRTEVTTTTTQPIEFITSEAESIGQGQGGQKQQQAKIYTPFRQALSYITAGRITPYYEPQAGTAVRLTEIGEPITKPTRTGAFLQKATGGKYTLDELQQMLTESRIPLKTSKSVTPIEHYAIRLGESYQPKGGYYRVNMYQKEIPAASTSAWEAEMPKAKVETRYVITPLLDKLTENGIDNYVAYRENIAKGFTEATGNEPTIASLLEGSQITPIGSEVVGQEILPPNQKMQVQQYRIGSLAFEEAETKLGNDLFGNIYNVKAVQPTKIPTIEYFPLQTINAEAQPVNFPFEDLSSLGVKIAATKGIPEQYGTSSFQPYQANFPTAPPSKYGGATVYKGLTGGGMLTQIEQPTATSIMQPSASATTEIANPQNPTYTKVPTPQAALLPGMPNLIGGTTGATITSLGQPVPQSSRVAGRINEFNAATAGEQMAMQNYEQHSNASLNQMNLSQQEQYQLYKQGISEQQGEERQLKIDVADIENMLLTHTLSDSQGAEELSNLVNLERELQYPELAAERGQLLGLGNRLDYAQQRILSELESEFMLQFQTELEIPTSTTKKKIPPPVRGLLPPIPPFLPPSKAPQTQATAPLENVYSATPSAILAPERYQSKAYAESLTPLLTGLQPRPRVSKSNLPVLVQRGIISPREVAKIRA